MLDTAITIVVAALAAIFISLPFFKRAGSDSTASAGSGLRPDPRIEQLKELNARKESLLSAIKDIEFDYGLGKLSREDYEDLNTRYKVEAAEVLKKMDEISGGKPAAPVEDELEKEIKEARMRGYSVYEDDEEIEKEILMAREASWAGESEERKCPECGSAYDAGDIFCSKCGYKLDGDTKKQHAESV
jgi:hypothetical protein